MDDQAWILGEVERQGAQSQVHTGVGVVEAEVECVANPGESIIHIDDSDGRFGFECAVSIPVLRQREHIGIVPHSTGEEITAFARIENIVSRTSLDEVVSEAAR